MEKKESAEKAVREILRKTRRRFSAEELATAVVDAFLEVGSLQDSSVGEGRRIKPTESPVFTINFQQSALPSLRGT